MHTNLIDGGLDPVYRPCIKHWVLRLLVHGALAPRMINHAGFVDSTLASGLKLPMCTPTNPARRQVLTKLERKLTKAAARPSGLPKHSPLLDNLTELRRWLALDELECQVLAFAVFARRSPMLRAALNLLPDVMPSAIADAIAVALDVPVAATRQVLRREGRLATNGLLYLDDYTLNQAWEQFELLRGFADAISTPQVDLLGVFGDNFVAAPEARRTLTDYSHIFADLGIIQDYLTSAISERRQGVNILIHGDPGTGKTELARALAPALPARLFEVAITDRDGDPIVANGRLNAYRLAQSLLGGNEPTVLLLDEIEDIFRPSPHEDKRGQAKGDGRKAWITRLLESNPIPAIWLSNDVFHLDAAFLRRFDIVLKLDTPPRQIRERILRQQLTGTAVPEAQISRWAEHPHLTPALSERAANVLRLLPDWGAEQASQQLDRLLGNAMAAQGWRREPPNVLPLGQFRADAVNIDHPPHHLAQALAQNRSGRLLFHGAPGTGKTALARWLADQAEMPLLVRRASDVLRPFLGESEQIMADMFRQAQEERAILLLDEADSFLYSRGGNQQVWQNQMVNEMLTQMECFNGVFIATTNWLDALDSAALRRFDIKIGFRGLRPEQARNLGDDMLKAAGLPTLDDRQAQQLCKLDNLNAGDFAAVGRGIRLTKLLNAQDLLQRLADEVAARPGGKQRRMGFAA